ncbi:hypothetical protein SEPCBS119000_003447 [Sporothrix epigloea]|uniref:4a-hydroxytetrahydrobiopterin dehydratase n=1 Tax=Sporothrix epigloea TaxID=1892477 RepID=A0ABP0DLR5_9PEZI
MLEAGWTVAKRALTLYLARPRALPLRTVSLNAVSSYFVPVPVHLSGSCRALSSTSQAGSQQPHLVVQTEADEATLRLGVEQLLAGQWSLATNGQAIERSFKFKNFTKTWDFMTSVALQCKLKNHHPEWSNVYTTTYIRWTTHHKGPGLTHKDVALAKMCDELGRAFGAEEEDKATSSGNTPSTLQSLANSAADAGNCGCSAPDSVSSSSAVSKDRSTTS